MRPIANFAELLPKESARLAERKVLA